MELDHLKLQRVMREQETRAFGPDPEKQIRQIGRKRRACPVPLEAFLLLPDRDGRLLHWLSWDATQQDAVRAQVAFHAAWQQILQGEDSDGMVQSLREIARGGASAESLIQMMLDHAGM
jgi:hypothetical protein